MRAWIWLASAACHAKAPPEVAYKQPDETPAACVERCVDERQMQAISMEAIEESCRQECGITEDPR